MMSSRTMVVRREPCEMRDMTEPKSGIFAIAEYQNSNKFIYKGFVLTEPDKPQHRCLCQSPAACTGQAHIYCHMERYKAVLDLVALALEFRYHRLALQ